jgi:hypothetical protein
LIRLARVWFCPLRAKKASDDGGPLYEYWTLIGAVDWGTNIFMFYETKDDLLKTTASYFEAGLANHLLLHGRMRSSLR